MARFRKPNLYQSEEQRHARDGEIVRMYARGMTLAAVAASLGCQAETARRALALRGVARRGPADVIKAHEPRNAEMVAMYQGGMTLEAIGEKFGVTATAVHIVLKARGIKGRPRGYYPTPTPQRSIDARARARAFAHEYDTGPGTSANAIAAKLGLDPCTVRKYLEECGVHVRLGAGHTGSPINAAQAKRIKAQLALGTSTFQEIADRYGISKNVINAIAVERAWAHIPWPAGAKYTRRRYRSGRILTPVTAAEVKALLVKGEFTMGEIADKYGVALAAIWSIAHDKNWKSVPWPAGRRGKGPVLGAPALRKLKPGMVLETEGRTREERRKGARWHEESRGRVGPV